MRGNALSRCVALLATAAFIWTLALTASPVLHERIHAGSSRAEHSCAVTFVSSGNYEHSAAPGFVAAPVRPTRFCRIPALVLPWVASEFLAASIFEHAPPALG
jgi:hypothetical protein